MNCEKIYKNKVSNEIIKEIHIQKNVCNFKNIMTTYRKKKLNNF